MINGDKLDVRILEVLQRDGRASMAQLAELVGLSASAVTRRIDRLESLRVIKGYQALLDPASVGLGITAFVTVTLTRQAEDIIKSFETAIVALPQVVEVHLMAGSTDYLLRVVAENLAAYERFLKQQLTRVRGIAHVQSAFSLSSLKAGTVLDLGHLSAGET